MKKLARTPTLAIGIIVSLASGPLTMAFSAPKAPLFRAFVVYSKASDHIVMSTRAKPFIQQMGIDNNFTADFTTDTGLINDTNLANYQLFIQLHLAPFEMSARQQAAFEKFVGQGKGWVGIHAAGLTGSQFLLAGMVYWQWYETFFGGVVYSPHPAYQRGTVIMEDRTHPATKNLPATWQVWDEWYEFNKSPRPNVRVLGRADESTYSPAKPMGDHPMIWTNEKYSRMIYICVGHDSSVCGNPNWVTLFHDAVMWAGMPPTTVKAPGISARGLPLMNSIAVRVGKGFILVDVAGAGGFSAALTDVNGKARGEAAGNNGVCRFERARVGSGMYIVSVKCRVGTYSQKLFIE